ncbi:2-oxoglutarate/Fe(II)-dependent oxygenase family protein [Arabidopsis thaliana]|uniref:2-oxoglutarate/Fe(II)-dependent oxygenase family protein n=1 Tax=Arabidopsis thaliana TaxID=3702 RepID=A0A1I9LS65_ARATH|nr:2-oxoglutarate/Fe(II)-dependent oxygenase family protein [Arabidopsis thaliana]ANM65423.1 2-oxoglutarate/Fe(II)-dependent oxygenase family protein [Arabidopsis thaliana]|eukprot:NP_001327392.1 2-oxoglutarate/Fe(II)-dependent oxygenase family protein [Arabidopsis thaliana]
MLSRTAPCFNGDIRSHERVSLPFLDFIRFCKQHMSDKRNEARSSTHYDAVFMKTKTRVKV